MAEDTGAGAGGGGYIRVGLRDVYEAVQKIERKVDLLVLGMESVKDHETRLRGVEKRVWALPSLATLIAIASLLVTLVGLPGGKPTAAHRSPVVRPNHSATTTTTVTRTAAPSPRGASGDVASPIVLSIPVSPSETPLRTSRTTPTDTTLPRPVTTVPAVSLPLTLPLTLPKKVLP